MGRPKKAVNPEIGKRIKLIRKHMKATQADFAEHYEVAEQTVRNWENGRNEVPMNVIEDLSSSLNIDIRFILCKTDIPDLSTVIKKWDEKLDTLNITDDVTRLELFAKYLNYIGYKSDVYSVPELNQLERDIREYITFKVNQIH